MMNEKIETLISLICLADLNTWHCTHRHVLEHIDAENYQAIVPKNDLAAFRAITDRRFDVLCEDDYISQNNRTYIENRLPDSMKFRAGWYLQQFVKLSAARQGSANAVNLIWDADNMPTRDLTFMDDGIIRLYRGSEHHVEYFDTIRKIMRMEKTTDHSFIAQCFATKKTWVNGLIDHIEETTESPWIQAIMDSIPGLDACEFSEYETLGTFISQHHAAEYEINRAKWDRRGSLKWGDPNLLSKRTLRKLSRVYDFVSFEKDNRKWPLHKRLLRDLKLELIDQKNRLVPQRRTDKQR